MSDPTGAAMPTAWRRWLPAALRVTLLATLAVLIWMLAYPTERAGAGGAEARGLLLWTGGEADALLGRAGDQPLFRTSGQPPTADELDMLAAAAERHPLFAASPPDDAVRIRAAPPERARAGWPATLPFHVHGPPGDTVVVKLAWAGDAEDSLRVVLPASGEAAAAFRVMPALPGWADWSVSAGGAEQRIGALIAPADSLRVLLAAGPPSWESKFVLRALEEAGVSVTLVQPLAPGLSLGGAPEQLPATAASLARFGAVLLLHGAEVRPAQRAALRGFVAAGGGVLRVGAAPPAVETEERERSAAVPAGAIRWALPADLTALPAASFAVRAESLGEVPASARVVAATPETNVLALQTYGRGRLASLALTDSWRWRMQAGQVEAHRVFWESLARWLAGGARDAVALRLSAPTGAVGQAVEVALHSAPGAAGPATVVLQHPSGTREPLLLRLDPTRAGVRVARFVPHQPGVYQLAADGAAAVGFRALADSAMTANPWARLAFLAHSSGGRLVPADSIEPLMRGFAGDAAPLQRFPWVPVLFGLAVALALTEWAIRRASGRP